MEIVSLITALRNTDSYIKTIYTEGSCYKFHLFLLEFWPLAMPVINATNDHVGSLIDGKVYDINGIAEWSWRPMDDEDVAKAVRWSFAGRSFLQVGECPVCEEPIVV